MANKNFILEECGDCSVWNIPCTCDKTGNFVMISVSKCEENSEYKTTSVDLDKDNPNKCPIKDEEFPLSKNELETFLSNNYTRIDNEETCEEFYTDVVICPQCNKSTDAGFGYEWNN